jgi:hypothetical protein
MHQATGRLDSPVAIPHTLGNWCICRHRHSSDRAPRPGVFQQPGNCRIRPVPLRNFSQFGNYTATRQLPATAVVHQATAAPQSGNCRTATRRPTRLRSFSQQPFLPAHAPVPHPTGAYSTTSPAGTNGPFQGPTNFIEWIVNNNDISHH